MAGAAKIVGVGFLGSLGFTFLILGCILSGKWWALLMFLFYGLTPLPLLFARNDGYEDIGTGVSKSLDVAVFFVTGMVVSTLAFPILLTNIPNDNPTGLFVIASEDEDL